MRVTAIAHPNVALAKYWGKREIAGNVPATPSLSVSLGGLETRTTVELDASLTRDELILNGERAADEPLARAARLLDEVRSRAGVRTFTRVTTRNDFPTASGLASSASGFAALARAATAAFGVAIDDRGLSRIARRASASAARSVFGGFVALGTEDDAAAQPIDGALDVRVVVAAVTLGAKETGSTSGMDHCRRTSPYYAAWLADAPSVEAEVRAGVIAGDLARVGRAAEASALRMHACMMASDPALLYWAPQTIELLSRVRALRARGVSAWATIDAGPHVKILCAPADVASVVEAVSSVAVRTIVANLGGAARVVPEGS